MRFILPEHLMTEMGRPIPRSQSVEPGVTGSQDDPLIPMAQFYTDITERFSGFTHSPESAFTDPLLCTEIMTQQRPRDGRYGHAFTPYHNNGPEVEEEAPEYGPLVMQRMPSTEISDAELHASYEGMRDTMRAYIMMLIENQRKYGGPESLCNDAINIVKNAMLNFMVANFTHIKVLVTILCVKFGGYDEHTVPLPHEIYLKRAADGILWIVNDLSGRECVLGGFRVSLSEVLLDEMAKKGTFGGENLDSIPFIISSVERGPFFVGADIIDVDSTHIGMAARCIQSRSLITCPFTVDDMFQIASMESSEPVWVKSILT